MTNNILSSQLLKQQHSHLPQPPHTNHAEMQSQHFSTRGFLWQAQHGQLVAEIMVPRGNQHQGADPHRKGTKYDYYWQHIHFLERAGWMLTAWEHVLSSGTWRLPLVCFRPRQHCQLPIPSAGIVAVSCLPQGNHNHWQRSPFLKQKEIHKASKTLLNSKKYALRMKEKMFKGKERGK